MSPHKKHKRVWYVYLEINDLTSKKIDDLIRRKAKIQKFELVTRPALQCYSRYEDTVTALDTVSFPDVQPQGLSRPLHNLDETRAGVGILNDKTQIR